MGYQVLYRTYRPQKFSEVVGQEYIIKTLLNALKKNKIAHAYLFAGPRGTGKTTIAKLFAKAINCEDFKDEACDNCNSCKAFKENNHPDIIEMDAASNNGVDDIRKIVEEIPYAPILGKYKVYIIDEVHMLTANAFNALLKTLEEPPSHVIFILATTDPQKIIPTVLSRCQRYNFSKISNIDIKRKLKEILEIEKIKFEDKALEEIAILAEGGMRDAESILEQILSYNSSGVFVEDIQKIFGLSSTEQKVNLLINTYKGNIDEVINTLRNMYTAGVDIKRLTLDLLEIVKETIIFNENGKDDLLNIINSIQAQDMLVYTTKNQLFNNINILEETINNSYSSLNILSYLEVALIQIASASKHKEENKKENNIIKETIKTEEVIKKEEITTNEELLDLNYIAHILLKATKEAKINDSIIYNRLDLFKLEPDKRKYSTLLSDTEIYGCSNDAIIIKTNRTKACAINSRITNEELYNFLNSEFGIDKMVYALDNEQIEEVVKIYRRFPKDEKTVEVIKYENKQKTTEDIARELFTNITVE